MRYATQDFIRLCRRTVRAMWAAALAWGIVMTIGQSTGFAADTFPAAADLPAHKELPDPLVMLDGERITTRDGWQQRRRPELLKLFQHYMYGYFPAAETKVVGHVDVEDKNYFGGKATKRQVTLTLGDGSLPKIHLLVIVPNRRQGPAPVFVGINFCGNFAVLDDKEIPLTDAWVYDSCAGGKDNRPTEASRGGQADMWAVEQTIDRGYAVALFHTADIDPDKPDFTDGIHPHFVKAGQTERGDHDWGTIAAWAWGIHRAVDYIVTDKEIDAKRIAVVGHSRNGKTALLAGAFDERIALAIPLQAGCGGTAPSRGTVGESVKRINTSFPHWFCDEFKKFNDHPEKLPFDQHCLVALMAPRPVLLANAVEDTWANPAGQFEVLQAARPVYKLFDADDLGDAKMPPPGKLIDGKLGYYIRAGKHSMTKGDWNVFCDYADKHFGKPTQ
ncbi:MAG: acetylxylan esterase [Pirellulales bacterium]